MDLTSIINSLPPPQCPEDLGSACPGPFQPVDPVTGQPIGDLVEPWQRVVGESRPGELDVTIRCKNCQAHEHYTIDPVTGQLIEPAALFARRQASGLRSGSDPIFAKASGASGSENGSDPLASPQPVQRTAGDQQTGGQAGKGKGKGMGSGISDSLYGGAGNDTLSGGGGTTVTVPAGGGGDSLPPAGGSGPSITLQTTGGGDTLPAK